MDAREHGGPPLLSDADAPTEHALPRTLGPIALFALGVGYVISGEYFGWNLGLDDAGTGGMLVATALATVLYGCFVLSYAELACALPRAGAAFEHGLRALPRPLALALGACQMLEFVFAPPAIALAIGAYLGLWLPGVPVVALAAGAYLALTALNVWGVRQAAAFEIAVTAVAVVELLVFMGVTAPAVRLENLVTDAFPRGAWGVLAGVPFALWLFLGIEGVANAAEEARDPQRDVPRGFLFAMATLALLAVGVVVCAVGAAGAKGVVYAPGSADKSDSPLPLAMAHVVAPSSALYRLLVGVGLFGLVASFHGLLLAAGRVTFSLGRAGVLPRAVGTLHARTSTPVAALALNLALGLVALLSGRTAEIITLSCFGALGLYALTLVSLFALRRREPDLPRPYAVPLYPVVPAIGLALVALAFVALVVSAPLVAGVFAALVAAVLAWSARARRGDSRG